MDRKSAGPGSRRVRRSLIPVRDLIDDYTGKGQHTVRKKLGEIFLLKQLWTRLTGDRIAMISYPYRLKDSTLFVAVNDPMWIAELPYVKREIITKLKAENVSVEDIKFTISKIFKAPPPLKRSRARLSGAQKQWAERIASLIKDEDIRKSYYNALVASMRHENRVKS